MKGNATTKRYTKKGRDNHEKIFGKKNVPGNNDPGGNSNMELRRPVPIPVKA